jgi:PHP family Zn ribbon phosphoesterase
LFQNVTYKEFEIMQDIHPRITKDAVLKMIGRHQRTLDNPGACTNCGKTYEDVEPDAQDDECEHCGELAVTGCENLLLNL